MVIRDANPPAGQGLTIASLAERPDLAAVFDDFPGSWPEFMYHDPISEALYGELIHAYPESNLIAIDPDEPGRPVARVCAFPFPGVDDPARRLPAGGYDQVVLRAAAGLVAGRPRGPVAAAIEVTVRPDRRGSGLSQVMLRELRRTLTILGHVSLVVPVRPNRKHLCPHEPMADYVARRRADGLPEDPWLRTHVRAGASIVGIAPRSMTVTGTLADWRGWTGLPFDVTGPVEVPQALTPVHCDVERDLAIYVEPNAWVHHRLS